MDRAPAGGCMAYGQWYDGGEFLPSAGWMERASLRAGRDEAAAAAREARIALDRAKSRHVGTVGERIQVAVTVGVVLTIEGVYGPQYITVARDENGNVYVSKGARWARKDEVALVKATVKAHTMRDNVAQTVIQRVKAG